MNIAQRNYTINRINTAVAIKIKALLAENDLLVAAHNKQHTVTFEEAQAAILNNPDFFKLVPYDAEGLTQATGYIDWNAVRTYLNKPLYYLRDSSYSGYTSYVQEGVNQLFEINGSNKVVFIEIAERIKKLQDRASFTKDQVMLGDAKEALKALEDFNSLVF